MTRTRDLLGPALRLGVHPSRVVLLAGMMLFAFDGLVALAPKLRMGGPSDTAAVVIALGLLRALLRSWLRPGYLRALRETWRGDDATFDGVVGPIDTFLDILLVNLVTSVVVTMSVIAGALPGLALVFFFASTGSRAILFASLFVAIAGGIVSYLYAWLGVRFAEHAVVLEGFGATKALARSWRAASGRRIELAKIVVAGALIEVAGLGWGLMTFGWGVVLGVPVGRLVSDYASVGQWVAISKTLSQEDSNDPHAFVPYTAGAVA